MRNSTNFDYCPHLLHFLSESDNNICNCLHEHTPLLIHDNFLSMAQASASHNADYSLRT